MDSTQQLFAAVKEGDVSRTRELLAADPALLKSRDDSGLSFLLTAYFHGKRDVADVILSFDPPLDLYEAATAGRVERARELLDAHPSQVNAHSRDGFFPLALAAFFGRGEVAELLLERGADVHQAARNEMRVTALHAAVASGQLAIARSLLERGAQVNARQQQGWTPLHGAVGEGRLELAELLLAHGADLNARNDEGKTPLAVALERNQPAVAEWMRRHGAGL